MHVDRPALARSRSARRIPDVSTRLPRTPSVYTLPPRRPVADRAATTAALHAQQGYYARKAAKLYTNRGRAVVPVADATQTPTRPSHPDRTDRPVDVINITVDADGVKIGDKGMAATSSRAPGISRSNSRNHMSRSNSRIRNVVAHNREHNKENFVTDERLDAHIEAYFSRKLSATPANVPPLPIDVTKPTTVAVEQTGVAATHSWDGSMPKRRNSQSIIGRQHANNSNNNSKINKTCDTSPVSPPIQPQSQPKLSELLNHANRGNQAQANQAQANQANHNLPKPKQHVVVQNSDCTTTTTTATTANCIKGVEQTYVDTDASSAQSSGTKLPHTGKWCEECAGIGLHISALISELNTHRPAVEAGATTQHTPSPTAPGGKKGWKSIVTQGLMRDVRSKSGGEKSKLQQEINVLRATVEFLYKKVERLGGGYDSASSSSATATCTN